MSMLTETFQWIANMSAELNMVKALLEKCQAKNAKCKCECEEEDGGEKVG